MSNETGDSRRRVSSCAQGDRSLHLAPRQEPATPDEMNTSFGPRIDADRWDFHDGIDLPARRRHPGPCHGGWRGASRRAGG